MRDPTSETVCPIQSFRKSGLRQRLFELAIPQVYVTYGNAHDRKRCGNFAIFC